MTRILIAAFLLWIHCINSLHERSFGNVLKNKSRTYQRLRKHRGYRDVIRQNAASSDKNQGGKLKNRFRLSDDQPNIDFFTVDWKPIAKDTKDDLKTVFSSFLLAIFVRVLLFEPRFIPSLSMFPTFDIGDQFLVDKFSHANRGYARKDVVVFEPSEIYIDMTGNTNALIKRVVAVAGDTVEVKNSKLYVNGLEQLEPYVNEQPDYTLTLRVVPPGMLMMLGDNRNHSFDSHEWGFLPEKNIIGRAVIRYWPPRHLGFIEGSD